MRNTREAVMTALVAQLQTAVFSQPVNGVTTWAMVSRKLQLFNEVPLQARPALFVAEHHETSSNPSENLPQKLSMEVHLFIYTNGRANVVGDWHVSNPGITQWFNPAAFAVPAPFTFGNAGKNVMIGPKLVNFDVSAYKNFNFAERLKLQFRSEFFNIANHANFANPAANVSVPAQVGRITATSVANRVIQFGLRLTF